MTAASEFTCETCGQSFILKREILDRYPGWTPRLCLRCRDRDRPAAGKPAARTPAARKAPAGKRARPAKKAIEENLTRRQVLERYTGGPQDGVFTDGACSGNPGPGGWGVVWVEDGRIVEERHGSERRTTNNRMELTALIAAYEMLPQDAAVTVWSDSQLCVNTLNQWAAGWERRGWKRKTGPVQNLDLVRRAYELARRHPGVRLRWIKAHAGSRWNEYADSLATSYLRKKT